MDIRLQLVGEVRWDGRPVSGDKGRCLITTLAAAGHEGVSTGALIDELWGHDLPTHPRKALQVLVARLRKATDASVIERTPSGYRLGLPAGTVDVLVRDDLLVRAEQALDAGDPESAHQHAAKARTIGEHPAARRVAAVSASQLGNHTDALPLLDQALTDSPYDDDLMLHLLESTEAVHGPSAALARFDRYRRTLASDLGSDPGPAVRAVHQRLLSADRPVRTGLRYTATDLLGRDGDLERLRELLDSARLVSIVGIGGLGKTRLAHELASSSTSPAVHVVELAGVRSGDEVPATLASALRVRRPVAQNHRQDSTGRSLPDHLVAHLRSTPTLLVLDNCEHVVEAVADLADTLLSQVGDLRILTTSRTPLRLTAEHVYALPALAPDDATALFTRRALAVRAGTAVDPRVVGALVERLDRLPLAIELAAATVRTMTVAEIHDNIADRFVLLSSGERTAPDRHRTLLAVIDWSWQLLTPPSREALMVLSILPDGFTLSCARSMVGPTAPDAVAALADHSLLTVTERCGELRYRMLETVREFGQLRLEEHGLSAAAHRARTEWAAGLCSSWIPEIHGADQLRVIDEVRAEELNLADELRHGLPAHEPGVAPVLAVLSSFWMVRAEHLRIFSLFDPVEDYLRGITPSADTVEALRMALSVLTCTYAMVPHWKQLQEVHRVLEETGPDSTIPVVHALCRLAEVIRRHGAAVFDDNAPDLFDRMSHDPDHTVPMLAAPFLANALENAGDPFTAVEVMTRALSHEQSGDAPWLSSTHRVMLAQLHSQLGEYGPAATYAAEALPVVDQLGADEDALQCRAILAGTALARGDVDTAEQGLDAIAEAQRHGRGFGSLLVVYLGLAEIAFLRGDAARGLSLLRDAHTEGQEVRIPGFSDPDGLDPWSLLADASVLAAQAWHAPSSDPSSWRRLLDKACLACSVDRERHDFPVLGTVTFALGCWGLRHRYLGTDDAAALLALADGLAYNRFLPSLRWQPVADIIEETDPGLLAAHTGALVGRRGSTLLPTLRSRLKLIARAGNS